MPGEIKINYRDVVLRLERENEKLKERMQTARRDLTVITENQGKIRQPTMNRALFSAMAQLSNEDQLREMKERGIIDDNGMIWGPQAEKIEAIFQKGKT